MRKQRVRGHVIADMSLYHLAYLVVKEGFTLETMQADYGFDGLMMTYDSNGYPDNGFISSRRKRTLLVSRLGELSLLTFQRRMPTFGRRRYTQCIWFCLIQA